MEVSWFWPKYRQTQVCFKRKKETLCFPIKTVFLKRWDFQGPTVQGPSASMNKELFICNNSEGY